MSLFERIEEFALQDNLDMFSLQEDLMGGDLGESLGLLDTNVGQDEGLKFQQPLQTSLENLVFPEANQDCFGEEWMETVDLSTLLNGNIELQPKVEVTTPEPEPEPRKEGLKASAFELLKQLLTGPVSEVQAEPRVEIPTSPSLPSSPEQQTIDLQFFTTPIIDPMDLLSDETNTSQNCLEDLIEIKSEESIQILENEILLETDNQLTNSSIKIEHLSPPQSIQSNDSFLMSEPSSPSNSFQTIDSSILGDSSDSCSQVSENDFTEIKPVSKRSKRETKNRVVPYEFEAPVGDKKVRKKMQNKNAATRYRVKKRQEKETLQEQEGKLSDRNKELREKVESLQREISYMKELMLEIQKAKQKKI